MDHSSLRQHVASREGQWELCSHASVGFTVCLMATVLSSLTIWGNAPSTLHTAGQQGGSFLRAQAIRGPFPSHDGGVRGGYIMKPTAMGLRSRNKGELSPLTLHAKSTC